MRVGGDCHSNARRMFHVLVSLVLIPFVGSAGCDRRAVDVTTPHNFSTPEGAVLCLEDAYRARDIEAAVRCKDFRIEAHLMLREVEQDFSSDEEVLRQTAEGLELAYRKMIDTNGFPDFDGLDCRFVTRTPYKKNNDIVVVTEICTFADGGTSTQRILVAKTESGWRVLNPLD